ncbi:methyl-accepting chemotaxis protein [uncultured Desulfobacter sp.]|uniref:methyl-accepting chemotaxis protein n=1 Tax=uncultured Desulfobacter sp. TaxID=240139 RepID=UPI0029F473A9|nr:methyl-accepting chemotaxis protein [uncultured Desulfobacter sp.]
MADASSQTNQIAQTLDEPSASASDRASQASTAVKDLGKQAQDVDAVTDEIRTIAEQVSLLALNAKIEAARAGEAGKGVCRARNSVKAHKTYPKWPRISPI